MVNLPNSRNFFTESERWYRGLYRCPNPSAPFYKLRKHSFWENVRKCCMKTQSLFQSYSCLKPGLKINFIFSTLWGCVSSLIRLIFSKNSRDKLPKACAYRCSPFVTRLGFLFTASVASGCPVPSPPQIRPPQLKLHTTFRTTPPNAFPLHPGPRAPLLVSFRSSPVVVDRAAAPQKGKCPHLNPPNL